MRAKRIWMLALACLAGLVFCGCVDQHPDRAVSAASSVVSRPEGDSRAASSESERSPEEQAAIEAARKKVETLGRKPRIIATNAATADICDRLNLDLAAVADTSVSIIPTRYEDLPRIGSPMSPDMEQVSALKPDWILSPASLQGDLQPKYEAIRTDWAFLNLTSVEGMYRSIRDLGDIFGREQEAEAMLEEYRTFYEDFQRVSEGRDHPRVLVLMGLPGSYVIATEHSYIGSLVAMAGGENVYESDGKDFLNINTEDMKTKEPDIILRAAHAMPDQVRDMFDKDFRENTIWQHFEAVEAGRVYDLPYDSFGMSAKFNYPEALNFLGEVFYGQDR